MEKVVSESNAAAPVDFDRVLALAINVGKELLSSGASVSRVEDAVERICASYGAEDVYVWCVPSMITGSITAPDGEIITQMQRVYGVANNLGRMERFNQLSRDICSCGLPVEESEGRLEDLRHVRDYNMAVNIVSGGVAAGAFAVFFGGTITDAAVAFVVGALMAFLNILLSARYFNSYARSFVLSFVGGICCILLTAGLGALGVNCHCTKVMIGTIMLVAPGLMVCNAVRDLFVGDLFSGTFQILNGILTILAVAAGYAAAMLIFRNTPLLSLTDPAERTGAAFYVYTFVACLFAAAAFAVMFGLSPRRLPMAAACAVITYAVYVISYMTGSLFIANLTAAVFGAAACEILARATKAPSTIYVTPFLILLVPGSSLYYTMSYLIEGDTSLAGSYGVDTLLVFLGIAVGLSIVAAAVQIVRPARRRRRFNLKLYFQRAKGHKDKEKNTDTEQENEH